MSVLLGGNKKSVLQRLKGNGIITVLDYLKEKRHKLHEKLITQKMLPADIDQLFNEIDQEIANLKAKEQDIINQLIQQQQPKQYQYLYLNNYQLFPMESISFVIGEIGSGKTTLLFKTIQEYLIKQQNETQLMFLDCANNLSPKRIFNIFRNEMSEGQAYQLFQRIHCQSFDNIREFEEVIKSIPQKSIIIIDGLLTLYTEFENEVYHLQHMINELMRYFHQLTKNNKNTFIIAIRSVQEQLHCIQGTKFDQYINIFASTIIHLLLVKQERVMKIHKGQSQSLPFDKSILYEINERGIVWKT